MNEQKKPLRRKFHVNLGSMQLFQGQPFDRVREFLDEPEALAKEKNFTDVVVHAHETDPANGEGYHTYLSVYAKRQETDIEYEERLKRIEENKVTQREYKLKQFNALKEELGL